MATNNHDIDSIMHSMHLTEEEIKPVIIAAPPSDGSARMSKLCLIGKLQSDKEQDVRSVRAAFRQSWGCNFTLVKLRPNVFQIIFDEQKDAVRVHMNGPWCFSDILLSLQRWDDNWDSKSDFFSFVDFWVHVVNLPFHDYTEIVGQQISVALKASTVCQLRTEHPSGQRFFRLRIPVDLRRSIRRFVRFIINGVELIGKLQYERLPHLCGHCGSWSHTISECSGVDRELTEVEKQQLSYGEKMELKAIRRSTLIMKVSPVISSDSTESNGASSQNPKVVSTSTVSLFTSDKGGHNLNGLPNSSLLNTPDSSTSEGSVVQHIRLLGGVSNGDVVINSLNNGEVVIRSHNHGESYQMGTSQPINQLVINFTSETTPKFTDLMRQFLRPPRNFNRQVQGLQSSENNYAMGILSGSRRRHQQLFREAWHKDIQMHNGDRPEMEKKSKATGVVDGESSLKKPCISLSEPLVESAESQAHPAQ